MAFCAEYQAYYAEEVRSEETLSFRPDTDAIRISPRQKEVAYTHI